MLLKVLIISLICVTSANALIGTVLIGLDLILSIISSGTSIALSLMPLMSDNYHGRDYSSDFKSIAISLEKLREGLYQLPFNVTERGELIKSARLIAGYASQIKEKHDNLNFYFQDDYTNKTLQLTADKMKDEVSDWILAYKRELVGLDNLSYVDRLYRFYELLYQCSEKSRQVVFYEMLRSYVGSETLAFRVIINCLKVREYLENKSLASEIENERIQLNRRLKETVAAFKKIIAKSSLMVTRCDLEKEHQFDISYTYFTALFQKMILGPHDLSEDLWPTCPIKSKTYGIQSRNCYKRKCKVHQRSCSNVIDCNNLDFNSEICLYKNQENTERRYQYVEKWNRDYEPPCPAGYYQSNVYRKGSKNGYSQYCDCICDDYKYDKSERHISLEEMTSDTKNNKVIVGLRFRKENKILSIDIREAELQPGALVKNNFIWKSIKNNKITENKYQFHKLSWFGNRGIMLDFINVPTKNHCITGIKFSTQNIGSEVVVALEIQVTKIDYELGQLIIGTSEWISYDYANLSINTINITNKDAPVRLHSRLNQNHGKHSLVHFQPTGYFTGDAGQTSVPYIDMQEIRTTGPIISAGLMHIDSTDSGGFIKLGVDTFNVTSFLH